MELVTGQRPTHKLAKTQHDPIVSHENMIAVSHELTLFAVGRRDEHHRPNDFVAGRSAQTSFLVV
jgi:hypothetical protein